MESQAGTGGPGRQGGISRAGTEIGTSFKSWDLGTGGEIGGRIQVQEGAACKTWCMSR